ncbi:unnamed protein product [Rotaria sp. Silwood1]|nr:unnamed protein product [Rotaria sp. Silwood1]CAF1447146.1 unnamed protein product [Rotaria sp. Silwood1]CAF3577379.1 unnamed protein product [Rotaria sp. Silwood1]CAF3592654.1 unnamed protein product [Rotaria sp. Silwood1]CAF4605420.1 unnamed protein product [Rotaria sp. Silwood1]
MFHQCENTDKYHIKSNLDYLSIFQYIQEFLCQNNEYINRPGPVCPFIPGALKQQSIYFFIANDYYNSKKRLIKMVQQCQNDFLHQLKPITKNRDKLIYKCLIILIRSSDVSHSLIDEIQTELKPKFIIQHGLMFGEFHQSSNSKAIRNENFYPFRTKVPLLVIRYMIANDIIFLDQKHKYSVDVRMNMIKKYLNLYHSGLLYRAKTKHLENANEILEELNSSIRE